MDARATDKPRAARRSRKNDPARTRANILEIATEEFATHGLNGARVDAIAARIHTSKRMIYYYFQDKEGLYRAVLEHAYSIVRGIEARLGLDEQEPEEALRSLVEQTFENDDANEAFVRLVLIENIHRGEHLNDLGSIRKINKGIITTIKRIMEKGQAAGRFRTDIDAIDVHMAISALCFFRVSNKHTFGKIFNVDLTNRKRREKHKRMAVDSILRLVRKD
jgi:AcrR family transcriptional regulator